MNPQIKVFSGALRPFTKSVDGVEKRFLSCTASSSITDMHGDEIVSSVIQDMAQQAVTKQMTIFLNHEYRVPEDVFGTTTNATAKRSGEIDKYGQPIWDLDLEMALNESNPRAVQTYDAYKENGVKMGVSIGAMIEDWEAIDQKAGPFGGLRIKGVDLLEASIVGIPANPRSWVKSGVAAIKKSLAGDELPVAREIGEVRVKITADIDPDLDKMITALHGEGTDDEPVTDTDLDQPEGDEDVDTSAASAAATQPDASPEPDVVPDQDATGDPEATADAATQPAQAQGADQAVTESAVTKSIALVIDGFRQENSELRKQLTQVTKERDEAQEALKQAMGTIERVSTFPLGRKTAFKHEVQTLHKELGGMYDEEFWSILERTHES